MRQQQWPSFFFSTCFCRAQEQSGDLTIGVLAHEGKLDALKQWESPAAYLRSVLNRQFTVIPLEFKEVLPAVQEKKVDFYCQPLLICHHDGAI